MKLLYVTKPVFIILGLVSPNLLIVSAVCNNPSVTNCIDTLLALPALNTEA